MKRKPKFLYYCECGCGNIPKGNNSYCRGHKKHSEETKSLIGINSGNARRGKKRGHYKEGTGENISKSLKGRIAWNKGVPNPELSERNRKRIGRKEPEDKKQKRLAACRVTKSTPEYHEKMRKVNKEINSRPEVKLKHRRKAKECWLDPEYKTKMKKKHKENWSNPEYAKMMFEAQGRKPNGVEIFQDGLIQTACPKEYIYSGDGKIFIAGKVPDWFNVNGKKKVIELFGNYWHSERITGRTKEQEEELRKSHFAKYGFDCLVIWENELKDIEKVVEKVREFTFKEV